jgi:hypothetical protein
MRHGNSSRRRGIWLFFVFFCPFVCWKNSLISKLVPFVSCFSSLDSLALSYVQAYTQSGARQIVIQQSGVQLCAWRKERESYLICWPASRWCRWPATTAVYGIRGSGTTVAGWTCPLSGPDDLRLDYWQTNPRAPFESAGTRLVSARKKRKSKMKLFGYGRWFPKEVLLWLLSIKKHEWN